MVFYIYKSENIIFYLNGVNGDVLFDYLPFYNSFIERIKRGELGSEIKKRLDKVRMINLVKEMNRAIDISSNFSFGCVINNL